MRKAIDNQSYIVEALPQTQTDHDSLSSTYCDATDGHNLSPLDTNGPPNPLPNLASLQIALPLTAWTSPQNLIVGK